MTPGLANGPPFPSGAVKGAAVAVASLDTPTVPVFVGVCEIDVSALGEVQGTKGHAVRGLHWEGDELWAWSSSSRPGQPSPEYLEGWDEERIKDVEEGVGELTLKEEQVEVQQAAAPDEEAPPAREEPLEPETEPTVKGEFTPIYFLDLAYLTACQRLMMPSSRRSYILSINSKKITPTHQTMDCNSQFNHLR